MVGLAHQLKLILYRGGSKRPGVGFGRGRGRGRECPNFAGAGNWPFWNLAGAGAVNLINKLSNEVAMVNWHILASTSCSKTLIFRPSNCCNA